MKFSLITATWNSEATIADTQRSIAQQDIPRDQLEWIVVDGASNDRTLELIKGEELQPDKLVSEPDRGIYDALNKGIQMAEGDFVGFLHADDVLASPNVLNRISCALSNSGADALYGDLQYVKSEEGGGFAVVRHWESGVYNRKKLRWGWMPPHPTFYLKREIFERTRLENGEYFDTSYTCSADYDFMMRVLGAFRVEPAYLQMVLVMMRLGGVSNRSMKHIITKSREDWHAIRRNRIGHIHTLAWKNVGKLKQFSARK